MVAPTMESEDIEIPIESFFLDKWNIEKEYPHIPARLLHVAKLPSHMTKKANRNIRDEAAIVSSGNPSANVKCGKRTDTVCDISTSDKSKSRNIKRNVKKSEKAHRKDKTVYPIVLTRNVPFEFVTQCAKKTDVFEIAMTDGQIKNRGRDVKQKMNNAKIIESHIETTGEGLSSTLSLRKSRRIQNRKNHNNTNVKNELSAQHLDGKLTKKAYVCLKDILNSTIKQSSKKENKLKNAIHCKEKKPNKDEQIETDNSECYSKKIDKSKQKSRYGPRYGVVSDSKLEKNDKPVEKGNESSRDGQHSNLAWKGKRKRYKYFLEDRNEDISDALDETWVEPEVKKKKIALKKLKIDKQKTVMKNRNITKTISSQNKPSEQKKMQNETSKQGTTDNVNATKTKTRTKKAIIEETRKYKTTDKVAATTYTQKKRKESLKLDDNVNLREKKARITKATTKKPKKVKAADEITATTDSKEKEKESLKPEDFVITAKRGTLRYLKQRERCLEAKAKEAEVEADYFSNNMALKKKGNVLNQLLTQVSHDDDLTIVTPKSKGTEDSNSFITPRTALVGKFGAATPSSVAVTPCSPLPSKSEGRDAALQVMFNQMKGAKKRPQGIRKNHQNDIFLSDSMLKKIRSPQLLELPGFSDDGVNDSSHDDDYFNYSDTT